MVKLIYFFCLQETHESCCLSLRRLGGTLDEVLLDAPRSITEIPQKFLAKKKKKKGFLVRRAMALD